VKHEGLRRPASTCASEVPCRFTFHTLSLTNSR
jgi:hypothetical protein